MNQKESRSMNIETSRTINASPAEVWRVLADLEKWGEWNPHIFNAGGKVKAGERLDLTMWQGEPAASAAKKKTQRFKPKVISADENKELIWEGRLGGIPGLFTGRHCFELRETAEGTVLTQSEEFSGVLVRPFQKMLAHLPQTFALVNDKLAERVEATQ